MGDDAMKIALLTIGDSQVGKSSLLLRFTATDQNKYKPSSMPTIGIDFKMKNVEVDGRRIKLQIVSTSVRTYLRAVV
jgi:Ras-related protein Rab-8A